MDVINAGLWALAGFDPVLQHFAELREHLRIHPDGSQPRVTVDRALGVYLEAQTRQLFEDSGYSQKSVDAAVVDMCGKNSVSNVIRFAASLTDDTLILEIAGYAMYLAALTSWGYAPWGRFAGMVTDIWHEKQRDLQPA